MFVLKSYTTEEKIKMLEANGFRVEERTISDLNNSRFWVFKGSSKVLKPKGITHPNEWLDYAFDQLISYLSNKEAKEFFGDE